MPLHDALKEQGILERHAPELGPIGPSGGDAWLAVSGKASIDLNNSACLRRDENVPTPLCSCNRHRSFDCAVIGNESISSRNSVPSPATATNPSHRRARPQTHHMHVRTF